MTDRRELSSAQGTAGTRPIGGLYSGRGAELYDLATRDDHTEIREFAALFRHGDPTVLELAAGSGRLTLPLARFARNVVAVDSSRELLAALRDRSAARADLRIAAVHADILTLRLNRAFDVVVLGTTTIAIFDSDERSALYRVVLDHLAAEGIFALSIYETAEPVALQMGCRTRDGRVEIHDRVHTASATRTSLVTEYDGEGRVLGSYAGTTHCLSARQLTAELSVAGFHVREFVPVRGARLREPSTHLLIVAERQPRP